MSIVWIGGGGNGGLTVNAIVAGMDKYLRISREKIHAWGGGATLEADDHITYGGNPKNEINSVSDKGAQDYNENTPQMYIPVEVDCELVKADILSDSNCVMPKSDRKKYNASGIVDMDVNNADYTWWVEQWRNDTLIGQIGYKFSAAGLLGAPDISEVWSGLYSTISRSNHGLSWFQNKTDASKKTESGSSYLRYDSIKLYDTPSTPVVYPDNAGVIDFAWGSAKVWFKTDFMDNNGVASKGCIVHTENESGLSSNIRGLIGSTANLTLDASTKFDIVGTLPEGTVVSLRAGLSYNNGSTDYMVEMDAVVSPSGGIKFYLSYNNIDVVSPTSKNIRIDSLDFDFDYDNVYVKTSTSGNWVKVTGLSNSNKNVLVASELTGSVTPINLNDSFVIQSHALLLAPVGLTTVTYHAGENGSGAVVYGTVPDTTGYTLTVGEHYYKKMQRVVGSVPNGFDLWLATSNVDMVAGNSYPSKVVSVDANGVLAEEDTTGSPNKQTPTTNTVDEQPPSVISDTILLNEDSNLGAFPTKLTLRKGDLISLRSTADVSIGGELTPLESEASRAYEMGCEIRLAINLL